MSLCQFAGYKVEPVLSPERLAVDDIPRRAEYLAVDRLLGRVQAVIQPLDEGLGRLGRFSGATILGDGSVSLILDLMTLIHDLEFALAIADAAAARVDAGDAAFEEARA